VPGDDQRYILTARLNGAWRWRAVDAPSIKTAIKRAKVVAVEMHDEHEVWRKGVVTLTDTKKRIVWSAPVKDLQP
jgi:hypothetical protein